MARRDRDERPPVELWPPESTEAPPVQRVEVGAAASPQRRRVLVGAAVAVVLLGAGLVLGAGGGDDPQEEAGPRAQDDGSETTRRARPATTTTREVAATTSEAFGPLLPEPVGAGLLLLGGESDVIWLDLDTGERLPVDLPGLALPSEMVPVRGGVAMAGPSGVQVLPLPHGAPLEISTSGFQVASSGAADAFWVAESGSSGDASATLFDVGGRPLQVGVPLTDGYMTSGTRHGLPRGRGGWTYLMTPAARVPLGPGVLLGASADSVVVNRCGEDGGCELLAHHLSDGGIVGTSSFGHLPADFPDFQSFLSPDGELLLLQSWGGRLVANEVRDRAGQVRWRGETLTWLEGEPAWLPRGLGLILPGSSRSRTAGSGRLVWFPDGVGAHPAPIRALIGTSYERMLLVTR